MPLLSHCKHLYRFITLTAAVPPLSPAARAVRRREPPRRQPPAPHTAGSPRGHRRTADGAGVCVPLSESLSAPLRAPPAARVCVLGRRSPSSTHRARPHRRGRGPPCRFRRVGSGAEPGAAQPVLPSPPQALGALLSLPRRLVAPCCPYINTCRVLHLPLEPARLAGPGRACNRTPVPLLASGHAAVAAATRAPRVSL